MKYPGKVQRINIVDAGGDNFAKALRDEIRKLQDEGYYVEHSFGGLCGDKFVATVTAREWIEEVDQTTDPVPSRFTKVKENAEEDG
jgi:hypothetical protein